MPVPSKANVDLKELAVKWRARLPVWYEDQAEVDLSSEAWLSEKERAERATA